MDCIPPEMPRYIARLMKNGLRVTNANADKMTEALHKLKGSELLIDRVLVINNK